jgi:hypothetical protein
MRAVLCALFMTSGLLLTACGKQPSVAAPPPAPQAGRAAAPPATQPAPAIPATAGTPAPPATPPAVAGKPAVTPNPNSSTAQMSKDAAQAKPLPPALMEKLTRPLTLEEINRLPPDVRDMILRAQGRLPASPSPKAKK